MLKNIVKERIIKINSYLNSVSLKTNKSIIKILIFCIIFLLPFYYLNCVPCLSVMTAISKWSILLFLALILISLGIYLLFVLKYKRIEYIIYLACAGTYISTEFYALALSKTVNINNILSKYYILLIILNILTVLWHIFLKDKFKINDKVKINVIKNIKKESSINISNFIFYIIIVLYIFVIYKIRKNIFTMEFILYIFGFIELFHIEYFFDFYIACKYKDKLELFSIEEK